MVWLAQAQRAVESETGNSVGDIGITDKMAPGKTDDRNIKIKNTDKKQD